MDTLDIRILREFVQDREVHPLQSEVRKSFGTVADRLDVDEATVRNRMRRLHNTGFIEEWNVLENPQLLGVTIAHCRCDVKDETAKEEAIQQIRLIQGVIMVTDYFGNALRVMMFHEDEKALEDQVALIRRICGSRTVTCSDISFPKCSVNLSASDWELIRSIRTSPWKQFVKISQETSLSTKTVKRRLSRLIQAKAIFLTLSLDPKVLKGAIPAELFVVFDSAEAKKRINSRILSHIDAYLISAQVGDPEHALYLLLLNNVSEATMYSRWVRNQMGVREAYLDLIQERIEQYGALNRRLDSMTKHSLRAAGRRR